MAQYVTPGMGSSWGMEDLLANSGGVVTEIDGSYFINEDLTISALDTIHLDGDTMFVASDVLITVFGALTADGINSEIHTLIPDYSGLRIEEGGHLNIRHVRFQGGGGIKCISGDIRIDSCDIILQSAIATNNSAIEFSTGTPTVTNTSFYYSTGSAISTAANGTCAPRIENCSINYNNTDNSNRPQVNLGPSGNDTIVIAGNSLIGDVEHDMAGAIAISTLVGGQVNAVIEDNTIYDNRYGIALLGNGISASIMENYIYDNNTQGDPFLGGSGINLNGDATSSAMIGGNTILNNLWGITVQNDFQVNLGNPDLTSDNPGFNSFGDNGNSGEIYALYNNTPSPILAYRNCWIQGQQSSLEQIEDVIFHENDDSALGLVDYGEPLCVTVGLLENSEFEFTAYPNPFQDYIQIDTESIFDTYIIHDHLGKKIQEGLVEQSNRINVEDVPSGLYSLSLFSNGDIQGSMRMVKD